MPDRTYRVDHHWAFAPIAYYLTHTSKMTQEQAAAALEIDFNPAKGEYLVIEEIEIKHFPDSLLGGIVGISDT